MLCFKAVYTRESIEYMYTSIIVFEYMFDSLTSHGRSPKSKQNIFALMANSVYTVRKLLYVQLNLRLKESIIVDILLETV